MATDSVITESWELCADRDLASGGGDRGIIHVSGDAALDGVVGHGDADRAANVGARPGPGPDFGGDGGVFRGRERDVPGRGGRALGARGSALDIAIDRVVHLYWWSRRPRRRRLWPSGEAATATVAATEVAWIMAVVGMMAPSVIWPAELMVESSL